MSFRGIVTARWSGISITPGVALFGLGTEVECDHHGEYGEELLCRHAAGTGQVGEHRRENYRDNALDGQQV